MLNLESLTAKRQRRMDHREQREREHINCERVKLWTKGRRTVVYVETGEYIVSTIPEELRTFCEERRLIVLDTLGKSMFDKLIEVIRAGEELDLALLANPNELPLSKIVELLSTARANRVEVIAFDKLPFWRRVLFFALAT